MKAAFTKSLANGELNPHHDRNEEFDKFV